MPGTKRGRPSPTLLVAIVALVAAFGGTAAGGVAVTALNGKEKRQVKKIAKKEARKLDRRIELTPGPQGPPGQNAAEEIVVRESALSSGPRTVSCMEGERVVGGGAETTPPAALSVNGPIVTGGTATGWKAQADDNAPTNALALCASP